MNKYDFIKSSVQEINSKHVEPKYSFRATHAIEKKTAPVNRKIRDLKKTER